MLKKLQDNLTLLSVAVPIYATVVHMRYDQGYLEHFGVPLSAFQPSLGGMLVSLAKVAGILFITLFAWGIVSLADGIRLPVLKRIQQGLLIFVPFSVPVFMIAGGDSTIDILLLLFFFMILARLFKVPAAERRQYGGYWRGLQQRINYFQTDDPRDNFLSIFIGFFGAVIVALGLANLAGDHSARMQTEFHVRYENQSEILVKQYADTLIWATLDSSNPPKPVAVTIQKLSEQPISLALKKIGYVARAKGITDQ